MRIGWGLQVLVATADVDANADGARAVVGDGQLVGGTGGDSDGWVVTASLAAGLQ